MKKKKLRCRRCNAKLYLIAKGDFEVWKKQKFLCNICKDDPLWLWKGLINFCPSAF